MAEVTLDDRERAVLEALAKEDDDAALAAYYAPIIEAAGGDLDVAQATLRNLKRRKLVGGEGRGLHASFWIEPKGREAIA
jgi:hypothetical protein